jgi:gas vesicle protein
MAGQFEAGASGAASGAIQGAQIGKMLGPKGMAAGAAIGAVAGGISAVKKSKEAERAQNMQVDDPDQLQALRQAQREYKSLQTGTSGAVTQNVGQQRAMVKNVASSAAKSQGGLAAMLSAMKQGQQGINMAYNQGQQQAGQVRQGIDQTISEMAARRDLYQRRKADQALADEKQRQSNRMQTINAFAASAGGGAEGGGLSSVLGGMKQGGAEGDVKTGTGAGFQDAGMGGFSA